MLLFWIRDEAIANIETNLRKFKARKALVDEHYRMLEKDHQRFRSNIQILRKTVRIAFERAKLAIDRKVETLSEVIELFKDDPALSILPNVAKK